MTLRPLRGDIDGTGVRLHANRLGDITQLDTFSDTGVTATYDFDGKFGRVPALDSKYILPLPDRSLPYRLFQPGI